MSNDNTSVISTSMNDAPVIASATANQAVNDNATLLPFSGITISEVDVSDNVSTLITLDNSSKGSFTTLSGFTNHDNGSYSLDNQTAAAVQTAIRGMVFSPTANRVAVGSTETTTFTIKVTDNHSVTATNNTTSVVSTSINDAPVVGGAVASQAVNDNTTLTPFSAFTILDNDSTQTQTVVITLDNSSKGSVTTLSGFTNHDNGSYSLDNITAANAQTAIRAMVFTPTANRVAVGSTETTTLTVQVTDNSSSAVSDNTTSIVATSINNAPTFTGTPSVTGSDNLSLLNIISTDVDVNDNITTTYQWLLDGATITGADNSTLLITSSTWHQQISCNVTITDNNSASTTVTATAIEALSPILALDNASNTSLTASLTMALLEEAGIDNSTSANLAACQSMIDSSTQTTTLSGLQALIDKTNAQESIKGYATADNASALTAAMLTTAGATSVTSSNLSLYQTAIAAQSSISDLAALQVVVDQTNALEVIRAYAASETSTAPTLAEFKATLTSSIQDAQYSLYLQEVRAAQTVESLATLQSLISASNGLQVILDYRSKGSAEAMTYKQVQATNSIHALVYNMVSYRLAVIDSTVALSSLADMQALIDGVNNSLLTNVTSVTIPTVDNATAATSVSTTAGLSINSTVVSSLCHLE